MREAACDERGNSNHQILTNVEGHEMSKKKSAPKVRNPLAQAVRKMGKRVVKARKGKGSYSRKDKWG